MLRRRRMHPDERDRVGLARLRVADRARLDHRLDCRAEAASLRLRKKAQRESRWSYRPRRSAWRAASRTRCSRSACAPRGTARHRASPSRSRRPSRRPAASLRRGSRRVSGARGGELRRRLTLDGVVERRGRVVEVVLLAPAAARRQVRGGLGRLHVARHLGHALHGGCGEECQSRQRPEPEPVPERSWMGAEQSSKGAVAEEKKSVEIGE